MLEKFAPVGVIYLIHLSSGRGHLSRSMRPYPGAFKTQDMERERCPAASVANTSLGFPLRSRGFLASIAFRSEGSPHPIGLPALDLDR